MRGAQIISLHYNLTNKAKHAFLRERGGGRVAVDGSEANVCFYCEQGWDPAGGSGKPHAPVRRSRGEGGG